MCSSFISAYAPCLLDRKVKRIRRSRDEEKAAFRKVKTVYESKEDRTWVLMNFTFYSLCEVYSWFNRWQHIFRKALTRPFQLFGQESIVQILGIYLAFVYGVFYRASS